MRVHTKALRGLCVQLWFCTVWELCERSLLIIRVERPILGGDGCAFCDNIRPCWGMVRRVEGGGECCGCAVCKGSAAAARGCAGVAVAYTGKKPAYACGASGPSGA